jgi:hypothetical protein
VARTIYTTRFAFAALATAGGFSRSYTVPAGKLAVVRYVGFSITTGPATVKANLVSPPGSPSLQWLRYTTLAQDANTSWEGRLVAVAGDVLTFTNVTAGSTIVTVSASGYLFTT